MSGSVNRVENDNLENHGENGVAIPDVGAPPQNPDNAPGPILVDVDSQNAQQVDKTPHTDKRIRHNDRQKAQKTPAQEEQEVSLHVIFEFYRQNSWPLPSCKVIRRLLAQRH